MSGDHGERSTPKRHAARGAKQILMATVEHGPAAAPGRESLDDSIPLPFCQGQGRLFLSRPQACTLLLLPASKLRW